MQKGIASRSALMHPLGNVQAEDDGAGLVNVKVEMPHLSLSNQKNRGMPFSTPFIF